MTKKRHNLFDSIQQVRMLAASAYDTAVAQGLHPADIQKQIDPLKQMLDECLDVSKPRDLMEALVEFDAQMGSHGEMLKLYQQKIADIARHRDDVERRLIAKMKSHGTSYLSDGDFVATLVKDGELERVSIR